jgi:Flp pilus assembly protein TadB
MPDGFPHRNIGLAALVVFVVAALLMGALLHSSVITIVALAVAVPIAIVLLARSARRNRNRVRPSR